MREGFIRFLVVVSALLIISTTAAAQLSVDPDIVDDSKPGIYNMSVQNNRSESADSATIILPSPDSITDPLGNITSDNIDVETEGWKVEKIWSRDSDGYGDTIKVSGQDGESLLDGERVVVEIILDGAGTGDYTLKANLSNGEEYEKTLQIDGNSPVELNKEPDGKGIIYPEPDIVAEFEDKGIGVDKSKTGLRINGIEISRDNLTVNEEDEVRYQGADLIDGENNIDLYIEDKFGHKKWINWSFTLSEEPIITDVGPKKGTQNKKPVIQAIIKDPSGLDTNKTYLKIGGDRYDQTSSLMDIESIRNNDTVYRILYTPDSELDNGEYKVELAAYDNEGHKAKRNWSFVVDTKSPTIGKISVEDGGIFSKSIPLHLEATDKGSKVERTVVKIGRMTETIYNSTFNGHLAIIDADINVSGIRSGSRTMNIHLYDHAGNKASLSREVIVDNHPPEMREVRLFPNPTNVAPRLKVRASDNNTEVEEAEYFLGEDPGQGKGISVPISSKSSALKLFSTSINTSRLSNGSQKLYVRAKDTSQQWSQTRNIELKYNPGLTSGLQFSSPDSVYVEQGERKDFDTHVTNVGKVPAEVTLSVKSKVDTVLDVKNKGIGGGDTRVYPVLLVPEKMQIGNYSLRLTADSRSSTIRKNLTVVVRANEETQKNIREKIEKLSVEYQKVRNRTSDWLYSFEEERSERINKSVIEVRRTISSAQEKIELGNYRYAAEELPRLTQEINNTKKNLKSGIDKYYDSLALEIFLIVVAVVITAGVAFFYRAWFLEEGFEGKFEYSAEKDYSIQERAEQTWEKAKEKSWMAWVRTRRFVRRLLGKEEDGWEGYEYSEN